LGLQKNAKTEDIKLRCRKLSLKYHPDRNKEPYANEITKFLNGICGTLKDEEKRKAYDNCLEEKRKAKIVDPKGKSNHPYASTFSQDWERTQKRKYTPPPSPKRESSQKRGYNYQKASSSSQGWNKVPVEENMQQSESWSKWIANFLVLVGTIAGIVYIYNRLGFIFYIFIILLVILSIYIAIKDYDIFKDIIDIILKFVCKIRDFIGKIIGFIPKICGWIRKTIGTICEIIDELRE
jgi:hypothetical protein